MRYIFTIIGSVVLTVTLVAFFFNLKQVNEERTVLSTNLKQRAILLADSLKESVEPSYANSSESSLKTSLQKIVDKFANRERLAGIALYDNKGTLLATSSGLPKTIIENIKIVADAVPITNEINKKLSKLHVNLTENQKPGSQIAKVKQMIASTKSDIFIFTQDDVRFSPHALSGIARVFLQNPLVTMTAARILPEKSITLFERIIEVGLRIVDRVSSEWNDGDNYLAANGRCCSGGSSSIINCLILMDIFILKMSAPEANF